MLSWRRLSAGSAGVANDHAEKGAKTFPNVEGLGGGFCRYQQRSFSPVTGTRQKRPFLAREFWQGVFGKLDDGGGWP